MVYGNHFLDNLDIADAAVFKPLLRQVQLEAGQVLVEQGARVTQLHFPVNAHLANVVVFGDGSGIETAVVGAEGVSGLAPFMADEPCSWRVVARAPGTAWTAPAAAVREQSLRSPSLMMLLLRLTHVYQSQGAQAAACNAVHRTTERVARWLLIASDLTPNGPLFFTQEELAALLGAQRTTINESTGRLKDNGAISYSRGVIRIQDRAALEAAACECYEMHRAFTGHAGMLPEASAA